jgi:hypothetical protein
MKIFSISFYKNESCKKNVSENLDKELKRKIKLPKNAKKTEINDEKYDE